MIDQRYYKEGEIYFLFDDNGLKVQPVKCETVSHNKAIFMILESATLDYFELDSVEYDTFSKQHEKVSKFPIPFHS